MVPRLENGSSWFWTAYILNYLNSYHIDGDRWLSIKQELLSHFYFIAFTVIPSWNVATHIMMNFSVSKLKDLHTVRKGKLHFVLKKVNSFFMCQNIFPEHGMRFVVNELRDLCMDFLLLFWTRFARYLFVSSWRMPFRGPLPAPIQWLKHSVENTWAKPVKVTLILSVHGLSCRL